jgi:drug/metabolite transporter (DMT)-like permease
MKNKISPFKADLMLLVVALLWGSSYVVTKNLIQTTEPINLVFYRFLIAAILSVVFFGKHLKSMSQKELMAGFFLGVLITIGTIFAISGVEYTTVSKNSFIVSVNVVLVPFVYWAVSKKKPKLVSIIAVILMTVGLAFLTLDFSGEFNLNKGDIITLGCVIFYASHIVYSDIYSKKYNPLSINMVAMITVAVISFMFLLIKGNINFTIIKNNTMDIIYLGVFPTFFCLNLQLFAQKYTTATHTAIILSLESVFATILAIVFLGEILTLNMIIGCIIIFISVLTSELGEKFLIWVKKKIFIKYKTPTKIKIKL